MGRWFGLILLFVLLGMTTYEAAKQPRERSGQVVVPDDGEVHATDGGDPLPPPKP